MLLRCWDAVLLALTTVRSLITGSATLMCSVLTPSHTFRSAILELELRCRTQTEIGLFATLVGVNPTEYTVVIESDPPRAYIYGLDHPDPVALGQKVREVETRLLRVTRGRKDLEEAHR